MFKTNLCWNNKKRGKNDRNRILCNCLFDYSSSNDAELSHYRLQLFHSRFEGRVLLFALTSSVRIAIFFSFIWWQHWRIRMQWSVFFSVPFNWKTLFGYSMVLFDESLHEFCTCVFLSSILCFLVGTCWIVTTIITDIRNEFSLLMNEQFNDRESPCEMCSQNELDIYHILQFYEDAKQLSKHWSSSSENALIIFHSNDSQYLNVRCVNDYNEVHEFIITGIFLWTTLTICCSLLVLHAEIVKTHLYLDADLLPKPIRVKWHWNHFLLFITRILQILSIW